MLALSSLLERVRPIRAWCIEITDDSEESKSRQWNETIVRIVHRATERLGVEGICIGSSTLQDSGKKEGKGEQIRRGTRKRRSGGRKKEREREKKRRWYRFSNEHTTQNTRVLLREMVRGDDSPRRVSRPPLLLLATDVRTMCSLYPTEFCCSPRPITT